jgi:hypothetical protein
LLSGNAGAWVWSLFSVSILRSMMDAKAANNSPVPFQEAGPVWESPRKQRKTMLVQQVIMMDELAINRVLDNHKPG